MRINNDKAVHEPAKDRKMQKRLMRFLPPIIWAALIYYLSSVPYLKSQFDVWDHFLRKGAHIFEYGILMLLVMPNFPKNNIRFRNIAAIICMLYAVTDEYHQSFVPGRHMSVFDVAWDSAGCLLAYVFLAVKEKKIPAE
ncbi:MAG: VanZ family protein [Elusimicrobiota bacterium]